MSDADYSPMLVSETLWDPKRNLSFCNVFAMDERCKRGVVVYVRRLVTNTKTGVESVEETKHVINEVKAGEPLKASLYVSGIAATDNVITIGLQPDTYKEPKPVIEPIADVEEVIP